MTKEQEKETWNRKRSNWLQELNRKVLKLWLVNYLITVDHWRSVEIETHAFANVPTISFHLNFCLYRRISDCRSWEFRESRMVIPRPTWILQPCLLSKYLAPPSIKTRISWFTKYQNRCFISLIFSWDILYIEATITVQTTTNANIYQYQQV